MRFIITETKLRSFEELTREYPYLEKYDLKIIDGEPTIEIGSIEELVAFSDHTRDPIIIDRMFSDSDNNRKTKFKIEIYNDYRE